MQKVTESCVEIKSMYHTHGA